MLRIILLFVLSAQSLQANEEFPIPFNQALTEMVEGHVKKQQADLTQAIADIRLQHAQAAFLPSLQTQAIVTSQVIGTSRAAGVSVSSSLNLYQFGRDILRYESALAMKESDEHTRRETKAETEEESAKTLLALIAAHKELGIIQRSLESRKTQQQIVEKLFKSGLRPLEDVRKMEIDVSAEENRLRNTQIKLLKAEGAIEGIIGKKIQISIKWPWTKYFNQTKIDLKNMTDSESSFHERNEAYLAIKSQLKAAEKNLQETKSKSLPSINLNVGWESFLGQDSSPSNHKWGGSLILTIPLWDKLNTRTELAENIQRQQSLALDLLAMERKLKSEWQVVKESFLTSLENKESSEKILGSARELYENSQKSFQSGLLSTNELDIEQARLLEAEMNILQSQYTTHLAFLQLTRNQCVSLITK